MYPELKIKICKKYLGKYKRSKKGIRERKKRKKGLPARYGNGFSTQQQRRGELIMGPGEKTERFVDVILTDKEVLEYGKEQAKLLVELKAFEAKKKVISDQMKPRTKRVVELSPMIDNGIEHRSVECVWEYNWEKKIKHIRRLDTDEIVGTTMDIEEHEQEPLPLGDAA